MISASVPETRARYASLTVEEALEKLREASETIESRGGVKPHEGRRVEEASQLITTSPLRSGSKTAERQQCYQQFLINVEKLCGIEMVILCAVGLGKSAVAAMKDRVRLRLPSRIKPQTDSLGHSILRKLVDEYSAKVRSTSTVGSSFESLSEETRTVAETQTPAQAPAPERESEPDARQTEQAGTRSETVHSGRQIQYMFSKAPTSEINLLGSLLSNAVQASKQWETERRRAESTTDCLTTLIPEGENEDISITLWVGRREGLQLLELLKLQRTWSALPSHLLLQPQTVQELHVPHLS